MNLIRSNSEDEEQIKREKLKLKRISNVSSPMSQCLIAQMSTPWLVESFKNKPCAESWIPLNPISQRKNRYSIKSRNWTKQDISRRTSSAASMTSDGSTLSGVKQKLAFSTLKSETVRLQSAASVPRFKLRGSLKSLRKKVPFKKVPSFQYRRGPSISRKPRFSITEPIADVDIIQTMLLPSYKNSSVEDDGGQVRKWLSDSSVKYNAESGLYEKNFTQIVLDRYNLPRMNILLQCLIDCLIDSSSQILVEESVPIFIWIIDRFKTGKNNQNVSMVNILEMTFLICDKLPCRCTESSNANYSPFNSTRKRVFQQIGTFLLNAFSFLDNLRMFR